MKCPRSLSFASPSWGVSGEGRGRLQARRREAQSPAGWEGGAVARGSHRGLSRVLFSTAQERRGPSRPPPQAPSADAGPGWTAGISGKLLPRSQQRKPRPVSMCPPLPWNPPEALCSLLSPVLSFLRKWHLSTWLSQCPLVRGVRFSQGAGIRDVTWDFPPPFSGLSWAACRGVCVLCGPERCCKPHSVGTWRAVSLRRRWRCRSPVPPRVMRLPTWAGSLFY